MLTSPLQLSMVALGDLRACLVRMTFRPMRGKRGDRATDQPNDQHSDSAAR